MAWIESHEELERHPKTLALAEAMGWNQYEASGRLHSFWKWCLVFAPTGDLHKYNDATIASGAGLSATDGKKFVATMTADQSRWIDRGTGPNGESIFRVHDWPVYTKKYLRDAKFRDYPDKWQEVLKVYSIPLTESLKSNSRVSLDVSAAPNLPTLPTVPNQVHKLRSAKREQEKNAMQKALELFGEGTMSEFGALWRTRFRRNPGKFERVISAVELDVKEGKEIANIGGHANDLWNRFAD